LCWGAADDPDYRGLPDNVVGIVARGRVTNDDCNNILKPLVESSLKRHDKVRLYYQIGCRYPGAAWEDLRLGMECVPQWERVAVVTDVGWVRHTINALRFLIPARCVCSQLMTHIKVVLESHRGRN